MNQLPERDERIAALVISGCLLVCLHDLPHISSYGISRLDANGLIRNGHWRKEVLIVLSNSRNVPFQNQTKPHAQ